jgi:hypothetical protein
MIKIGILLIIKTPTPFSEGHYGGLDPVADDDDAGAAVAA